MTTHEVVRPGTLPSELTLQLILGNAIEVVFLLQADVPLAEADRQALLTAATTLSPGQTENDRATRSHALPPDALDILSAARDALAAEDMTALRDQLSDLANALRQLAEKNQTDMPTSAIVDQLTALRNALASRTAMEPDEVRGLLPVR